MWPLLWSLVTGFPCRTAPGGPWSSPSLSGVLNSGFHGTEVPRMWLRDTRGEGLGSFQGKFSVQ